MQTTGGAGGTQSMVGSTAGDQSPPQGGAPPHTVSACPVSGEGTGKWENITPPGLSLDPAFKTPAGDNYGAHAFVVDPQDNANLYIGSSAQGIFKSTDCGSTWSHVSHGDVDTGRNGSMVIDPVDSKIIYTDARYGPLGLFKSTNGGVDWTQVLPPDVITGFGSIEWIAMDPTDHTHLTLMPHFNCMGAHAPNCMVETTDGGATWSYIDKTPESTEFGGHVMLDRKTWLVMQLFGQIWRTADGGKSWAKVFEAGASPYLYKAADNSYYVPGINGGLLHSTDGIAWTATPIPGGVEAFAPTKTALIIGLGVNNPSYQSASLDELTTWTPIDKIPVADGNGAFMMAGDADHNLAYSTNFRGGFWRYSVK